MYAGPVNAANSVSPPLPVPFMQKDRRPRPQPGCCDVARRAGPAIAAILAFLAASSAPALADIKLCNSTSSRIGVSIGYQDAQGWATEGWWTISSQTCETLLKGIVPSQFIYVHAIDYDRGGEWAGTNFMCTDDKSFVIRGVQDCSKRGFKRSGFFEVNTGDAKEWTVRLTDPEPGSGKTQ
jgi:uncharacterized membrane protein